MLLAACSVAGALYSMITERRAARPDPARPATERYVMGALTGVGFGMGVATLLLLAAALVVRLEP